MERIKQKNEVSKRLFQMEHKSHREKPVKKHISDVFKNMKTIIQLFDIR
jgi:hypothetical protein